MAWYYAICIIVGCLGAGCMFPANQACVQFVPCESATRRAGTRTRKEQNPAGIE